MRFHTISHTIINFKIYFRTLSGGGGEGGGGGGGGGGNVHFSV